MASKCVVCQELFIEGDQVEGLIRSTFHVLKSKTVSALDREDMEVIPGTLAHVECCEQDDEHCLRSDN